MVLLLLMQLLTAVWYCSNINSRVDGVEAQQKTFVSRAEYVARDEDLQNSLADIKASQVRLEEKIDRISEAQHGTKY